MTVHRLHPNTFIGEGTRLGDFVVIGTPPRGRNSGDLRTIIGAGGVIRSHAVLYSGNVVGDHVDIGHGALVREGNHIGSYVTIGSHAVIEFEVQIGNRVEIAAHAFIPEYCVLEDGCWIGPGVALTNSRYPRSRNAKQHLAGVRVGRDAQVGAGAIVLPGRSVGAGAIVEAGAVVVKDVPEKAIVSGSPARVVSTCRDHERG